MAVVSSVAALAALGPQLSLAGIVLGGLVVPSASFWSALDPQQAPAGVALMRSVVLVSSSVSFVGGPQQNPFGGVALVVLPMQAHV